MKCQEIVKKVHHYLQEANVMMCPNESPNVQFTILEDKFEEVQAFFQTANLLIDPSVTWRIISAPTATCMFILCMSATKYSWFSLVSS